MKRLISIILAAGLIFSLCTPAFAAKSCNCGHTPVVYIPGFGEPVYNELDSEEPVSVFPPSGDAIAKSVPDLLMAVMGGLLVGNDRIFGKYAIKGAEKMLGAAALNPDGTAIENSGVDFDGVEEDLHKIAHTLTDEDIDDKYFTFLYDWRLSPVDNAKLLRNFVNEVKATTGHKKISFACHSQGNTVLMSYLALYGGKNIDKIVCLSPAYKGLSLVGALFTEKISVSHKGDALETYLKGIMGYEDAKSQLIGAVVSLINDYGLVDFVLNYVQKMLDAQLDKVFDECLIDIFGTMPGLWSFVPDEYYDEAKETMLKGDKKYDGLVKRIDYYHDNVQTKVEIILKQAKADGAKIIISAGYNISSIPVTFEPAGQSDFLIDTKYMTLGATCAPINGSLGENYKQANRKCGHNHLSPDGIIDASTCAFSEYTWFVRDSGHSDLDEEYLEFINWTLNYKGQPTVRSSKLYPQFMMLTGSDELKPASSDLPVETRSDEAVIIASTISLIKESF
ncbi:MAG: hypothetical protein E7516_06710 [Ruminococcaceae bacterium]|nr:hypothetical protein [Oscillospiraceae bacterium]